MDRISVKILFVAVMLVCIIAITGCGETLSVSDEIEMPNSTESGAVHPAIMLTSLQDALLESPIYLSAGGVELYVGQTLPDSARVATTYATKEILKYDNELAATVIQIVSDAESNEVQHVSFFLPHQKGKDKTSVVGYNFAIAGDVSNKIHENEESAHSVFWDWLYSIMDEEKDADQTVIHGVRYEIKRSDNNSFSLLMDLNQKESKTTLNSAMEMQAWSISQYIYKSPEDLNIIESILNSDVMTGIDREDIDVVFLDDDKSIVVSVSIHGVGAITNNYSDFKNKKTWDEYVQFQKKYCVELSAQLVGTQKENWNISLLTVDEEKLHLMVENGEVIYNIVTP